jgi:hypothetical protein
LPATNAVKRNFIEPIAIPSGDEARGRAYLIDPLGLDASSRGRQIAQWIPTFHADPAREYRTGGVRGRTSAVADLIASRVVRYLAEIRLIFKYSPQ